MSTITRRTLVAGLGISAAAPTLAAASARAFAASRSKKDVASGAASTWRNLWDGRTLAGWQTYLRGPKREDPAIGVDKDPNGVFSIMRVDGEAAIRISGQDWGGVSTIEEFSDYHFRVEFKWGEQRWAPRANEKRDSGILYHCVGLHGAGSGAWMRSFELQVQYGDCGDFYSVDGVIVDVEGVPRDPLRPDRKELIYQKGAPEVRGVTHRIIKAANAEKPHAAWNVAEVIAVGDTAVHLVNGQVMMVLKKLRHRIQGTETPLTRGRIQIQSEGAEVFYRRAQIRPLRAIPPTLA
jgi:hypothetical protein